MYIHKYIPNIPDRSNGNIYKYTRNVITIFPNITYTLTYNNNSLYHILLYTNVGVYFV